ncbi:MAG TPA: hypothetical protein VMN76_03980 [Acidobacteriota bacterium]|nr:hypothetical protein [Acidobacteriota bacterium]
MKREKPWQESEKRIYFSRIFEAKKLADYGRMEEEVRRATERFPADAQFQILMAEVSWRRGRTAEADSILRDLASQGCQSSEYFGLIGAIELDRRKPKAALEAFSQAAAISNSNFYRKRQAECLLRLKRYEESLALWRSLNRDDQDPYVLGGLARALEGMGELDQARNLYREIQKIRPNDSFARSRLLKLELNRKQPETAEREIQRILDIPSRRSDAATLTAHAEQLKRQQRFAEAAEVYAKLVESASIPERNQYLRDLAFSLYKADHLEKAFPLFLELFEGNPRDPYLRTTLISISRRLKQESRLKQLFSTLARENPSCRFLFGVARKLKG